MDPPGSIPALRWVLFMPPAPRDIGTAVLETIAAVCCLERYLYKYMCIYIYSSQEFERITPGHGNDGNGDSICEGFKQGQRHRPSWCSTGQQLLFLQDILQPQLM